MDKNQNHIRGNKYELQLYHVNTDTVGTNTAKYLKVNGIIVYASVFLVINMMSSMPRRLHDWVLANQLKKRFEQNFRKSGNGGAD